MPVRTADVDHGGARGDNTTGVPETIQLRPGRVARSKAALLPPDPIGSRGIRTLLSLVIVAMMAGYQGSLPTVVMTYVADDFGASDRQQTTALAVIRLDIIITLFLVRAADRAGRRRMLLICATVGPLLTSLCARTNSLAAFVAVQVASRAFVTAVAILVTVIVVEEMPARSRAWAGGTMVASAALGSGIVQGAASIADRSAGAWRWPFLVPLISLPFLLVVRKGIPETRRFEQFARDHDPSATAVEELRLPTFAALRLHGRRLLAVAAIIGLIAFQNNPARQLRNDFLRTERGFTGNQLSLFGVLTNAPGVFGVVLGSVLGDRRGRRLLISVGLIGIALGDFWLYRSHGSAIWIWSIIGALLGSAALPAIGILAAELMPTQVRSTANGFTTFAARVFGFIGLITVSLTADRFADGRESRIVSWFSVSLLLAVLVLWRTTPETSRRELEDINPEDAPRSKA
jgi:MFS family permease